MFQQRHYRETALLFQRKIEWTEGTPAEATVRALATDFADMFGRDNGLFNRSLFLAACEPGANVNAKTADGALKTARNPHKAAFLSGFADNRPLEDR